MLERFQNNDIRRIIKLLDEVIRSRGYGEIRKVDRAVGRQAGWWQNRVRAGNLSGRDLLRVMDHLGLDPVKSIRRGLGREEELELDRPQGQVPELVTRAWERFRSQDAVNGVGRIWIQTLDDQRLENPARVVELARWGVDHVELELLPRLLGAAGIALVVLVRLQEAQHVLTAGIDFAIQHRDRAATGNLLRRLASAIGYQGDPGEALRLVERATLIHFRTGDSEEIGKSLAAQGTWLYYLGRHEEAVEILRRSTELLVLSPSRERFAAYQSLGHNYRALGDLIAAKDSLQQAGQALPENDPWSRGKLLWLQASVQLDLGDATSAIALFQDVIQIFHGVHPGEAALATCELIRVKLKQGDLAGARLAAIGLKPLIEPLRHNKVISAALADLLRLGRKSLTLALVQQAITKIEGERQSLQEWSNLSVRLREAHPMGSAMGPIS